MFCSLAAMMNLIKTKGALGIRGHIVFCVLVGLLVSGDLAQAEDNPEKELAHTKLRLNSLKNRYKLLCNQYANLTATCSATAPEFNCTECPPEWFQVGDHCFILSKDKQDFRQSEKMCKAIGGHLAILTTNEEHEAVEKESRLQDGFDTHYWIGLTDKEEEGSWKWVDNSALNVGFWDMHKSEPDNNPSGGPEGEDCAVVDSRSKSWFDVPCSYTYRRICQRDTIPLL